MLARGVFTARNDQPNGTSCGQHSAALSVHGRGQVPSFKGLIVSIFDEIFLNSSNADFKRLIVSNSGSQLKPFSRRIQPDTADLQAELTS
jgi:hypothetical protein